MNKTVKKIWNIVSWFIISVVVLLIVLILGIQVVGYKPYSVLSGSMEPNFHVGSLVYVKNINPDEVKVGDAITFKLVGTGSVATHRVAEIDKTNKAFTTKGDANESADANPVKFENVIGQADFSIPYLGFFTNWIASAQGKIISVCIAIVLIILILLPDMLDKAEKDDKKKSSSKEEEIKES